MWYYGFRGKRTDNGEWAEGDLLNENDDCFIRANGEEVKVSPETVCIWTLRFDSNNKRIYKGDIVECTNRVGTIKYKGEVIFKCGAFFVNTFIDCGKSSYYKERLFKDCANIVVVGNTFDGDRKVESK